MSQAGRLAGVQHLRAAAALAVVAYHALQWRSGGFDLGRAGVDVFFVVSGLVLWRAAATRPVTPRAFLIARIRRILPSYWLVTVAVAVIAGFSPAFLPQVRPSWTHLTLSLALIPHFDPRGLPFPTLPVGWTLCYEAGFYILFAAALALPHRWRFAGLIGSLVGVTATGYVLRDPWFVLGANPMMLEFAGGISLGVLLATDRLPARPWGWAMLAAGLAGFVVESGPGRLRRTLAPASLGRPGDSGGRGRGDVGGAWRRSPLAVGVDPRRGLLRALSRSSPRRRARRSPVRRLARLDLFAAGGAGVCGDRLGVLAMGRSASRS